MNSRRLIVNWRHESTRAIVPVAELVATRAAAEPREVRYEFGYIEGVRRALELGFQPFLAFPHLDRRYAGSNLFPFFRNRVLPSTRPDYAAYVEALGLSVQNATEVELLGRSEGRRQTDRVETVLAAERDPDTGRYVTFFLLRAVRHIPGAETVIAEMRPRDELEAVPEPTNEHNPGARQLRFEGSIVGYIADYLLTDLDRLVAAAGSPRFVVERINPPPHPAHHRVLVRVDAAWPSGFEPFDDPVFLPYRGGNDGESPLSLVG
ncbi:hypothetical protein [Paraliomyxa miuraensis]|uniref:hypothetical protein n=1 Tax=Paraliomyxa miuraensis TaxID=376150 RepID=UPI00224EB157|nr:hypothetical protein [Paraliomyxa miuraensis]MCX4246810.1 hypothetical protein [Paraliomyxa miuraensis]